ncbi:hypothetical protein ZWY2020_004172 [Hordeum vulgare]|nr:hypothetical protein ZWY2020_004172 [Hordeum vulgare]
MFQPPSDQLPPFALLPSASPPQPPTLPVVPQRRPTSGRRHQGPPPQARLLTGLTAEHAATPLQTGVRYSHSLPTYHPHWSVRRAVVRTPTHRPLRQALPLPHRALDLTAFPSCCSLLLAPQPPAIVTTAIVVIPAAGSRPFSADPVGPCTTPLPVRHGANLPPRDGTWGYPQ